MIFWMCWSTMSKSFLLISVPILMESVLLGMMTTRTKVMRKRAMMEGKAKEEKQEEQEKKGILSRMPLIEVVVVVVVGVKVDLVV
ncbi:hypothetical protein BDR26DRAFT_857183 [Obelidium mucronatum]|nr:hypothetical protein BDR26DRAFT_857183 [Obelidium mucronatum]